MSAREALTTRSEGELAAAGASEAAGPEVDRARSAVTLCTLCRKRVGGDAVIATQGPVHQECLHEPWGE